MANNGFVGRYKGRMDVDQAWIGGVQQGRWGTVFASTATGSSLNLPIKPTIGVINMNASTVLAIYTLGPPTKGDVCVVNVSTMGSSGAFIKASTTPTAFGNFFRGVLSNGTGGSTNSCVVKTTVASQLEFIGISTSEWLFMGVLPSTVGHLTWSTST